MIIIINVREYVRCMPQLLVCRVSKNRRSLVKSSSDNVHVVCTIATYSKVED